jgi:hypothetical protein
MDGDFIKTQPLEEPQAQLELALIREFLEARGHDLEALRGRADDAARELLTQASIYAATKLTEVESRAHYIHDIHEAG